MSQHSAQVLVLVAQAVALAVQVLVLVAQAVEIYLRLASQQHSLSIPPLME